MNTLIAIGFLGDTDVYLNVKRDEAIERYAQKNDLTPDEVRTNYHIKEFEFTDEFGAYDIWK